MRKIAFLFLASFAVVGCDGGSDAADEPGYADYRCEWEATSFPADLSFAPKRIRVLGNGEVWVVGSRITPGRFGGERRVTNDLVARRSAGVWEPHVQTGVLGLAIDGTGENDVWIAGVHGDGHVVVRRWDGLQWTDEG